MGYYLFEAIGFRSTRMTESPLKNILLMYRSLLTGLAFFLPEMITYMINKSTNEELQWFRQKLVICAKMIKNWGKNLPFPVLGSSVHISLTFSRTMLQCLSKALTRPKSFLLFLQLMRTWVLFLTDWVRTDRGPVLNSSSSRLSSSSGVISDFGLFIRADAMVEILPNLERFSNFSNPAFPRVASCFSSVNDGSSYDEISPKQLTLLISTPIDNWNIRASSSQKIIWKLKWW